MRERGVVRGIPGCYYSKSLGRRWREGYTRMILLQIMREMVVVRAIPGLYYSKSWRGSVWWELH
jgi:hypothetical protein